MSALRLNRPARKRWAVWVAWIVALLGVGLVFAPTFIHMWGRWFPAWYDTNLSLYDRLVEGESYYTHGPLVPLISLVIAVVLIRHTRIEVRPRPVLGVAVVAVGLLIHLVASLGRIYFPSGYALIVVLAGLVVLAWGTNALRRFWFPLVLLAFMVPIPQVTIGEVNLELKLLATQIGVTVADLFVVALRDGNIVRLGDGGTVTVANVCNGLRTIISLIGFGALYAYVCRLRGAWRIGLFVMVLPVALLANSLRVILLIIVAALVNPTFASGWFHDLTGLLVFVMAFGMMFGIERGILAARSAVGRPARVYPLFYGIERDPNDYDQWTRMGRALARPTAWFAAGMIVLAVPAALWLNRAEPPVGTRYAVSDCLPATVETADAQWRSWPRKLTANDLRVLETSEENYAFRQYVSPAAERPVDVYVIFSEYNRKAIHPPDLCLEGVGEGIMQKGDVTLDDGAGDGGIVVRELITQTGGSRGYYLYVYKVGPVYTPSFWRQQIGIFTRGLVGRDTRAALLRVSTTVPAREIDSAREQCKVFMRKAIQHLEAVLATDEGES